MKWMEMQHTHETMSVIKMNMYFFSIPESKLNGEPYHHDDFTDEQVTKRHTLVGRNCREDT